MILKKKILALSYVLYASLVYFWQSKSLIVPQSFFSPAFFFIFIPISSPPCPIVPATWHEPSFLDSHSARRRTALQLPAKTPYLCLAACRQDGGVGVRWGGGIGGAGEGKGYRMGWGKYKKGLGGGCIGEKMLKYCTQKV